MSSRDFLAQAAATLEAALALEARKGGAVALEKAYGEAVQAVQYASAFEDRGAAFQAAQDGVVEVLRSRIDQLQSAAAAAPPPPPAAADAGPAAAPAGGDPISALSDLSLDSVVGLDDTKAVLREIILLPLQHPQLFRPGSIRSPLRTVLLSGPPGTGKTMLARCICAEAESGMEFIAVSPSTLLSKWVGESERTVARLFAEAKAGSGGCVLFFDECDSFALDRSAAPSGAGSNVLLEMLIQVGRAHTRVKAVANDVERR